MWLWGASAGIEVKDGTGSVGAGTAGSVSMVLRRDLGRCSAVERMKGSLDSNPPAPDELRFLPGAGGRFELEAGGASGVVSADVGCSMANGIWRSCLMGTCSSCFGVWYQYLLTSRTVVRTVGLGKTHGPSMPEHSYLQFAPPSSHRKEREVGTPLDSGSRVEGVVDRVVRRHDVRCLAEESRTPAFANGH